jgi:hypothetical protein
MRNSIVFVVYRRTSGTSYTVVPNSTRSVSLSTGDIEQGFQCLRLSLNSSERFLIQENDVIGVCFDNSLSMISESNSLTQVYQSNIMNCNSNSMREIDVGNNFRINSRFTLHLQADIGKFSLMRNPEIIIRVLVSTQPHSGSLCL